MGPWVPRIAVVAIVVLGSLATVTGPAWAGDGTFAPRVDYDTAGFEGDVAVGDFNSDGREDLAVVDSGRVSTFLGNGDGTFGAHTDYAAAVGTNAIAVGDLDGDGDQDLVTSDGIAAKISVLLNAGDGTFAAAVDYAAGSAESVAVGDFDADGDPDVVVSDTATDSAQVLLNNGNGIFAAPVAHDTDFTPLDIAVGDFNSDGRQDLAVAAEGNNNVSVMLGDGAGGFPTHVEYHVGVDPERIATGDFDGDGDGDLATANFTPDTVSILLNNGDGTFPPSVPFTTAHRPQSVAVGDFNSDGDVDLAVGAASANQVSILPGAGDGTFLGHVDYATAGDTSSVAVGDFDSDGNADIAATNDSTKKLSVLLGQGAPLLSGNLLQNGGAEGAGAARTRSASPPIPGWTPIGGPMTYVRYGTETHFSSLIAAPRWEGGLNMFSGGPQSGGSSVFQTVDVAGSSVSVDAGLAKATLTADLGGYSTDGDTMSVVGEFDDAGGASLGTFTVGPVTKEDTHNLTVLLRRSQTTAVPPSTRSIKVTLVASRFVPPIVNTLAYDNAYADNVKLTLDAPAPQPPGSTPDTTAPQTNKGQGPKKKIHSTKAKFVFSSDDPAAKFSCQLDHKPAKTCSSPAKVKHLKRGKHRFTVDAADAAGNKDATPAVWKFKVVSRPQSAH
jgi:FG-GAP-like repeat